MNINHLSCGVCLSSGSRLLRRRFSVVSAAWLAHAAGALICLVGVLGLPALAQTTNPPRVAIMDEGNGAGLAVLDAAGGLSFPVAVRLELRDLNDPSLETRLQALERRRVPLWLVVSAPSSAPEVDLWRQSLRAIVNRRTST